MKVCILSLTSFFLLSNIVSSMRVHSQHEKDRKVPEDIQTSKFQTPSTKDKTILRDTLHLLNIGKQTLNLSTEEPEWLMGFMENSTLKTDGIHRFLKSSSSYPASSDVEEYLVLSDKNGHIQVENYSKSADMRTVDNVNHVEDVFKLVLRKKYPQKVNGSDIVRRITIIESNQLKPFDKNEFRYQPLAIRDKRHEVKYYRKLHNPRHSRKKRMRKEPDLKYLLKKFPYNEIYNHDRVLDEAIKRRDQNTQELEYPFEPAYKNRLLTDYEPFRLNVLHLNAKKRNRDTFPFLAEKPMLRFPPESELSIGTDIPKDVSTQSSASTVKDRTISGAHEELSLEKSLLMRVLELPSAKDVNRGSGVFLPITALTLAFVMCILIIFMIYRHWQMKKDRNSRTVEFKGANIIVRLGESLGKHLDFSGMKHFNIPLGKMDYQLVPVEELGADLEWQSENGEWLSEGDFEQKEVYS